MLIALPSRHAGLAVFVLVIAVTAATFSTPAEAQWRWRDANGRVTASDRPPPKEIPDKDILGRPAGQRQPAAAVATPATAAEAASAPASAAAPALASASGAGGLQAEVEARRKRVEQERVARAKADEERLAGQRAENCRRARAHAAAIESGQRMARVNERGEREVLDDRGRAEELRSARAVIASDCR